MGGVLFGLYVMHREQREVERGKREQYWREQVGFPLFQKTAESNP